MKDTDEDGLTDILERSLGYNPYNYDTDGDGMSDGWEHQFKSPNIHPLVWNDPNGDVDLDANGNVVGDGVSNIHEFFYKTNPNMIDSDGDGYNDDVEIAQGTDPKDPNSTPDPNNLKPVWKVTLGVGDESSSNSEHYKLVFYKINEHGELLESNRMDFSYEAPGPGQYSGPEEFTLPETAHGIFVVLWWIKSNKADPDFDYTIVCEKYEGDFFVFDPDGVIDQVTGNESETKSWDKSYYPPEISAHSGVTQADVRGGHRIALLPIKIVPDDGSEFLTTDDMIGVVGDMIPSINTTQPEYHFVTPKDTTEIPQLYVNLKAVGITEEMITPGHADQILEWDPAVGEAVAGEPLKWRVKRDVAAKNEVFIREKESQEEAAKLNVWVVWSTVSHTAGTKIKGPSPNEANPALNDFAYEIDNALPWKFVFSIAPSTIVDKSSDVPDLTGANVHPVPGAGKPYFVPDIGDGDTASLKWDVSRQVEVRIRRNPNEISDAKLLQYLSQAVVDGLVLFPSDPVEGNDDGILSQTIDEHADPYTSFSATDLAHSVGELSSRDAPVQRVLATWGSPGFKYGIGSNFREFARLEIADSGRTTGQFWFRISDHFEWCFALRSEFSQPTGALSYEWNNDDSASSTGNTTP